MDKTPKFSEAIAKILKDLKPHEKACNVCKNLFRIDEKDIEFFNRFQVPAPKMCPGCRRQRRFAFANYTTLFKRDCNVPNHSEKVISSIPEGTKFPIYDFDYYWHSDRDLLKDGRNFDLNKNFMEQFKELFLISPQPALTRDPTSVNSDYTNYGIQLKNCYYTFGGINSEEIMFSVWPLFAKNSLDMLISQNTDFSYNGVFPDGCYNCNYVYFSKDCLVCDFIYDCRNCSNCFGCVNLRNKKYCIWNTQYNKEDYLEKIKEFNLGDRKELKNYIDKLEKMIHDFPIRATRNEHSENYSGNYIINSKNTFNSFWCLDSENNNYTDFTANSSDNYDCSVGSWTSNVYSTICVGVHSSNVKFSSLGRELRDSEYIVNCKNCQYCFGCIGLYNAKFCIFNKQYTEEEYWKLVEGIKIKMLESEEYGEFFPLSISPFPYNASLSNIMYPTSKEKVLDLGGWWYEDDKINIPENMIIKERKEISEDIENITDDILDIGIKSEGNGKLFRIVKDELEFYRRKKIAIPSLTPYERIIDRFKYVNNFKVFKDKCFKCGLEILSSYATSDGFKPYCDDCYKKEIY